MVSRLAQARSALLASQCFSWRSFSSFSLWIILLLSSPPPPTLPSMSPSTVSSGFSLTDAWKGGPWLGCGDLVIGVGSLGRLQHLFYLWSVWVRLLGCSQRL